MAAIKLLGSGMVRVAWTDVGDVGVRVVRRPALRKIDRFSQGLSHLRLEHVWRGPAVGGPWRGAAGAHPHTRSTSK